MFEMNFIEDEINFMYYGSSKGFNNFKDELRLN